MEIQLPEIGLLNQNNLSYLHATTQAIIRIPKMKKWLADFNKSLHLLCETYCKLLGRCVLCAIKETFDMMHTTKEKAIHAAPVYIYGIIMAHQLLQSLHVSKPI